MLLSDISDQLRDNHSFTNTRTAVGSHLASTRERRNQIQDLDARLQNFGGSGLLRKSRWLTVNRQSLGVGRNLLAAIDRVTEHIEDATQRMLTYRHRYWLTSVYGFDAPRQSIGSPERKTSRPVVANVLFDLEHQPLALVVDFQTAVDLGKIVRRECNVDDRADNLDYFAFATLCHLRQAPIWCCPAVRSAGRISSIVAMS